MSARRTPARTHARGTFAAERNLEAIVEDLTAISDPVACARSCGEVLQLLAEVALDVKNIRYEAMKELNEAGLGYGAIAEKTDLSKGRVQQILAHLPPTKRMGRVEVEARQQAERLRGRGADDQAIVAAVVPRIIEIRSAERYTPADIAGMLNVPTEIVRPEWSRAKRAKERGRTSQTA